MQTVLILVRAHRCSWLWGLPTAPTIILCAEISVLVCLSLGCLLGLAHAVILNYDLDFGLTHLVEPGLCQGVDGCEALLWVQCQHSFEALNGLRCHLAHIPSLQRLWLGLGWELQTHKPRILIKKLLLVRCQLAKDFLNAEKLVNFWLTGEQGIAIRDFSHNAPNGPNIDLFSVLVAQEEFRRSVPACRHIVR